MAQALQLAGLPLEGRHHRGVDDAWNIAALALLLEDQDRWARAEA
jgi:inhibitor of KinA sporulation pathway (predicted exonuclease)